MTYTVVRGGSKPTQGKAASTQVRTYSVSGRALQRDSQRRLVGICEVRIDDAAGVLYADPNPDKGRTAAVHKTGSDGATAAICLHCFHLALGPEVTQQCQACGLEPASIPSPQRTRGPKPRRADDSDTGFKPATTSPKRHRGPTVPAIAECSVLDAHRCIVAVPRRLKKDLTTAGGTGHYCSCICTNEGWLCTGCGAYAGQYAMLLPLTPYARHPRVHP